METNDLRTLRILEQVQSDYPPSQRDLARDLNVSVGLVNSFIKRMAQKGYVKVSTIPKNRIRYILTPKGIAAKTKLTYDYIQYSYHFYKQSRQKLRALFADLEAEGVRRIAFFGASDLAEIAFLSLQETAIELVAVVDDRKSKINIIGRRVMPVTYLAEAACDRILITDDRERATVKARLLAHSVPREKLTWVK
jgi:DNA-binding MarR family transcriptional regulator